LETIAVYWESRVKIYSITEVTNLSMTSILFPPLALEKLGRIVTTLEEPVHRFELVTQDYIDPAHSQLNLFYDRSKQGAADAALGKEADKIKVTVTTTSPVELIYLHGPHFQDRFGIADTVFSALKGDNIQVITTGCAGTTIYIALPRNQADQAAKILRETFIIPTTN